MTTWNWAARIGGIAVAAVLHGGSHGYGVRDVVLAAEEGGPAAPQVRARVRSESLTLVDTIDFSAAYLDRLRAGTEIERGG
ncbi:MAG TPA: hypothetical protein VJ860_03715 [Polyangia bacterium]|nr:hypothetical protein [Polyangia bacterium]